MTEGLAHRLARFLVRRRKQTFVFGVLLTLALMTGLAQLQVRNDYRAYFPPGDPWLETADWLSKRQSEAGDVLALVYVPQTGDVFTGLAPVQMVEIQSLLTQLPSVLRVETWLDARKISVVEDPQTGRAYRDVSFLAGLNVFDPADQAVLRADALATPTMATRTVGRKGSVAVATVYLDFGVDDPEREAKLNALHEHAHGIETALRERMPGDRVFLVGTAVFDHVATKVLRADVRTLGPIALLLIALTLWRLYGSWRFTGASLVLIVLPVLAAAGTVAWLGAAFSTLAVSGLLLVGTLAVADILHITNGYCLGLAEYREPEDALEHALTRNIGAVTATTVTTAIGQIAMLGSVAEPIRVMGTVVIAGVWVALILALAMLPAILMATRLKGAGRVARLSDRLAGITRCGVRHAVPVVACGLVLVVASGLALSQARIGDSLGGWFSERTEFRQGMDLLSDRFVGSNAITVALEAPRQDLLQARKFPEQGPVFDTYYTLRQQAGAASGAGTWFSVADAAQATSDHIAQSERTGFVIPPKVAPGAIRVNPETLAKSGLMTPLSFGRKDFTIWRFEPDDPSSFALVETGPRIEQVFTDAAGERSMRIGGLGLAFAGLSVSNFQAIVQGSLLAFALISLSMFAVLRSARLGLLSLLPNIAPILVTLGAWAVLAEQFNMATATVFSVAMGLVVDDTIHIMTKYRHMRHSGLAPPEAAVEAVRACGAGLLATTVIIASGFFLLAASGFLLTAQKAGLVGVTIVFAFFFDVFVLPALLVLVDDSATASLDTTVHGSFQ